MSTPAGWYDDGSGRQRWWDGAQWTDDYAPVTGVAPAGAAAAPGLGQPVSAVSPVSAELKLTPVLGFVGLGLAVLGTVLVCIPTVVTCVIGGVVLLGALVVSLIAVFKKNTKKWPSIVGIVLSVVGGIIGVVVFSVVLFVSLVGAAVQDPPTSIPAPSVSEQPSDAADSRPSPEAIGDGIKLALNAAGRTEYNDVPGFYPCVGQALYESELSDDDLQLLASGADVTGPDRELSIQIGAEAIQICDPQ